MHLEVCKETFDVTATTKVISEDELHLELKDSTVVCRRLVHNIFSFEHRLITFPFITYISEKLDTNDKPSLLPLTPTMIEERITLIEPLLENHGLSWDFTKWTENDKLLLRLALE